MTDIGSLIRRQSIRSPLTKVCSGLAPKVMGAAATKQLTLLLLLFLPAIDFMWSAKSESMNLNLLCTRNERVLETEISHMNSAKLSSVNIPKMDITPAGAPVGHPRISSISKQCTE